MKYQLRWDAETESGYVVNDIYSRGYVFGDPLLKPVLENTGYESLIYDELTNTYNIIINGVETAMSAAQKIEGLNACSGWVDTSHLSVELTLATHADNRKKAIKAFFTNSVNQLVPNLTSHEMVSWRKQEDEARAWLDSNLAVTTIIDILLVERDLNETKAELVDKIIINADLYITTYAGYLGRFQKAIRLIDAATTKDEINLIGF